MYRDAPDHSEPQPEPEVLARVDASGVAGAAGRHGHRGSDGGGSGADGSAGGHAAAAQAGSPGGRVDVSLVDAGSGDLVVRGERVTTDGRTERIDVRRTIGERGFVDLVARGGVGGAGGHGGSGGDGARGRKGADATRYSSGGNGGAGGDGGDGGRGTSGAAGGRGGVVQVRVRDEDTHLLLLVRTGIDGGPGGARGAHGRGGSGGAGGSGGSSHHWTTTETYRDSQGHTQHRTHHHSSPGGSSGPSGRHGRDGSGPLADGPRGADGTFTIEVEGRQGRELFETRYHLALAGVEVHTPDEDGITEPGERVELRRVRVTNVGGMPTPRHHETRLEVALSNWAEPLEGAKLVVPPGLPAGATVELEGPLPFRLRDYVSTAESDPLAEREAVVIDARIPDVARSFEGFLVPALTTARTLLVRFPAALSVLEGLSSLAPDEITRLRFAVTNPSRKALGARSEGRRRLRVRLGLFESELDDRHVVLFDEAGRPQLLGGDGFTREIELLDRGEQTVFELSLGVRADAPAYRALRVRLTLEIGRLDDPETLRVVQHRALEVRVAERVGAKPFEWLLVTSHKTTREEVDAWRALAARRGVALALYDLSLHGDLRLDAPFEGGPSLVERAAGGLVILLDYALDTPAGPRAPSSFLTRELVHAMSRHRADLLVLGGHASLREWVFSDALAGDEERTPLTGTDALFASLERVRRDTDARDTDLAIAERVEVHEVAFGFETPSEERLRLRAQATAERLARLFPEREHEVIFELDPDTTPSWAPIRRRRLGWLRVLSRAAGRSGAAHVSLGDDALHAPETIGAEMIGHATLLARGVDDRLRALGEALATEPPDLTLASLLADALLVSVACEQLSVVRRTRARAGLDHEGLARALPALRALANTRLLGPDAQGAHAPDAPAGEIVARIAGRARFFARAQAALWERVPGLSWARRSGALVAETWAATSRMLARQSGDPDVARVLEDRARVELERLEGEWRTARENGQRDKAAFARLTLLLPTWSSDLTVDEELVLAHVPTAQSRHEWDAARSADAGADRAASQAEEQLDAHRARLGVPESTEARLAQRDADAREDDEQRSARHGAARQRA